MQTITIQALKLKNFKGCENLELVLNGKNAGIYGDNATGKTTVYDALTWLLFGKDSHGSAEQETIKPLDAAGNVKDHNAVTTVEAVLSVVDGEDGALCAPLQVKLRKEMNEAWTTRRGSSATVYDGNTFSYFWDDVPLKKSEYTRRVGELVDEEVFKMLTSVTAFAFDLPWRKRREILYELSGAHALSDRALLAEAAKADPDNAYAYRTLSDQIGGTTTLDDYKRILLIRRKGLLQTRDQTPARIDEVQKQLNELHVIDFAGAEEILRQAEAGAREVAGEIALAKAEASNPDLERRKADLRAERSTLNAWRADELRRIGDRQDAVRAEIRALENRNREHRRQMEAELPNEALLRRAVESLQHHMADKKESIAHKREEAKALDGYVDSARAEWVKVNGEEFAGAACPTCGQELPFEMLEAARKKHEDRKAERLAEIQSIGNRHLLRAQELRAQADDLEKTLPEIETKVMETTQAAEKAVGAANSVADMDGYREEMDTLTQKLDAISAKEMEAEFQAKLADIKRREDLLTAESDDAGKLQEDKLNALNAKANEYRQTAQRQREILGKRSSVAYLEQRIDELTEGQRRASAELEDIDRQLWAMEAFIRFKTHFIEDSVNGLFRIVTFRLFREQANGGLEERCDVVVNGVPYAALNNGARINAGMDIIRRLAEHYAVRVPLFVDNAESVTRLEDAGTQVIRLVVSEQDDALRVVVE